MRALVLAASLVLTTVGTGHAGSGSFAGGFAKGAALAGALGNDPVYEMDRYYRKKQLEIQRKRLEELKRQQRALEELQDDYRWRGLRGGW